MIEAAVRSALDTLGRGYTAPFCLPRVTGGGSSNVSTGSECNRKSPQDHAVSKDVAQDAAAAAAAATAHFIPEESAYLSGSIQETREAFLSTAPKFDLIVLDPPGRTSPRGERLAAIPPSTVSRRLGHFWITSPSLAILQMAASLLYGGVLASWGLEVAAEWIWVKLTSRGEPIFDPESAWRKPWERLIIARKRGDNRKVSQRVIAAVPDVHSRKPNLRHLFEDELPQGYLGLEIFARNLTAGWWGWGNEVLRFQEPQHWIVHSKPERTGPRRSEPDDTNTN
ncbi:MT-A70 family protein [Colletotrichum tofieldiae]|nr:MT-A70 family protein [Colletotrichum tofieldiae]